MERARAKAVHLQNVLALEQRSNEAKNRLPAARGVAPRPHKENKSRMLAMSMQELEKVKRHPQLSISPGREGTRDVARASARLQGLEKEYQRTQHDVSQWNQSMERELRSASQDPEIEPEQESTPMKMAFRSMSNRLSTVTNQLFDEDGLNCYPFAIQEGMEQVRDHLKYSRCAGEIHQVRDKVTLAREKLAASADHGGSSPSPHMKKKIGSLRSRIQEMQYLAPNKQVVHSLKLGDLTRQVSRPDVVTQRDNKAWHSVVA
eukprot:TRINITY_DN49694_c0_g2_i3.p1 TRINITY_DN49694_c0_g2~~TRINITY_DN49694_c0_g2_i3.p1  ORF type:complete len:261 (-),score=65.77 TRINITY_DN49694_c0_g2_i3:314-1096(-)